MNSLRHFLKNFTTSKLFSYLLTILRLLGYLSLAYTVYRRYLRYFTVKIDSHSHIDGKLALLKTILDEI